MSFGSRNLNWSLLTSAATALRRRHLTPRRNERSGTADAKLDWRDPCGPGGLGQGSCQASFPSWAYHHIVRIQKWCGRRVPFQGVCRSAQTCTTAQFLFGTMCDMSGRGSKVQRDSPLLHAGPFCCARLASGAIETSPPFPMGRGGRAVCDAMLCARLTTEARLGAKAQTRRNEHRSRSAEVEADGVNEH